MKISKLKIAATLAAALAIVPLLSGCVNRITDFTLLSTKNIDLTKASNFKRAANRVTGEDKALVIIIFPTGVPSVKEAVDKALEGVPGAVALVDGVVKSKGWWFIYGENSMIVEGTPLIDPSLAAQPLPARDEAGYAAVQNSNRDDRSAPSERILSGGP